jgi:hypothetical protein
MLRMRKRSAWEFSTSMGRSISVLFVGAAAGGIILTSPTGGNVLFNYGSAGVGLSVGIKYSTSFSTYDATSGGRVYLLDTFSGDELAVRDIEGGCLIGEFSLGAALGGSFTGMLLGIPLQVLEKELVVDALAFGITQGAGGTLTDMATNEGLGEIVSFLGTVTGGAAGQMIRMNNTAIAERFQSSAKALLVMGGLNAGVQLGIGVLGSIGYLFAGART